jgi:vitamin B12 transporter
MSAAILLLVFGLLAARAGAQTLPPVQENVVVSASLAPEKAPAVSASVTVITRAQIEKSGRVSVLELLRDVPGVDVVQAGGPGKQTSVFLRGTNSTQTLVLVDGVRVNSPFFSGYDFSALSTQNVERIEIARGPFSALYGSDAVGGVISIWTRAPSAEPSGRATAAAGNKSFHEETLFASAGAGDFALSVSARDVHDGGDEQLVSGESVNNDGWRDREAAARLQWTPSASLSVGAGLSRTFARSRIPASGARPTPRQYTDFAQTIWSFPVSWRVADGNDLRATLSEVDLHPTAVDPDSAFGPRSDTLARTRALRAVDQWELSGQTVSAVASFERSTVDETDPFGSIAGRSIHSWGLGVEDRVPLLGGKLVAVAGVRYDRHSAFGGSTNPRVSVVWNAGPDTALRASYGAAFRAPSIGELFYPIGGNPDLSPERSRSYEIGLAQRAGGVELDVAVFRNDVRDLIQYDFASNLNENVGRARTEGVELSAGAPLAGNLRGRLSYTYLRAVDRETGLPLARRPRHRGSIDVAWSPSDLTASVRAVFVGRRADIDAATFRTIEDPSYLRLDAHVSYRLGPVAPFLRVDNLTDRRYAEADGFPAPRRRVAAGVSADF